MKENIQISKKLPRLYKYEYKEDFRAFLNYYCNLYSEDNAFIIKEKKETKTSSAQYRYVTFHQLLRDINSLSAYLTDKNFQENPIALIGKNSYDWFISYLAVLNYGNVVVPLDKDLPVNELISSLERSKTKTLVYSSDKKNIIDEIKNHFADSITFISMDDTSSMVDEGNKLISTGYDKHLEKQIDPSALAVILFTSGTTSASKAVQLSQKNILSVSYDCVTTEDIRHGDVNMAFLPYHHTFGSTGQVVMINAGVTSTFCDGLKYVQKNLIEYKVSLFVCVPLLIEAIYKKVLAGVKKQGKEKQLAAALAVSRSLKRVGIDVRRKIFKNILDQLGGNLRYIISGASPLDPVCWRSLNDFGITVVQGYGLTESAPVLAAESPKYQRSGSCGLSMPSVDISLSDVNKDGVGELIARGPGVMLGYMENPNATADTVKNGWLYTGDLAKIDKDGFIYILGRKKNVIVLRNGKNVYAEELEILLGNLPFVQEVMVFGQDRDQGDKKTGARSGLAGADPVVTAKIVYDAEYMQKFFSADTFEDIEKIIKNAADKINDSIPAYKQIKRLILTDQPMEKTTTGKIKRYKNK
ncbi:AMP-binding protein [Eubacteriales bacterium KG127]